MLDIFSRRMRFSLSISVYLSEAKEGESCETDWGEAREAESMGLDKLTLEESLFLAVPDLIVNGSEGGLLILVSNGALDGPELLLVNVAVPLLPSAVQDLARAHSQGKSFHIGLYLNFKLLLQKYN